jgi:hypothetical protein
VTGGWFSPGSSVSVTNKTDFHNITEILLEVALNTINQQNHQSDTIRKLNIFLCTGLTVPMQENQNTQSFNISLQSIKSLVWFILFFVLEFKTEKTMPSDMKKFQRYI